MKLFKEVTRNDPDTEMAGGSYCWVVEHDGERREFNYRADAEAFANNNDPARLLDQAVGSLVAMFDRGLTGDAEMHSLLSGALDNLYAAQRHLGVIS
jgi:hypothetical protein